MPLTSPSAHMDGFPTDLIALTGHILDMFGSMYRTGEYGRLLDETSAISHRQAGTCAA